MTSYTVSHAASDIIRLLPYIHENLVKQGTLHKCCYCGAEIAPGTGHAVAHIMQTDIGEWGEILMTCPSCNCRAYVETPYMRGIAGLYIPSDQDGRFEMVHKLNWDAIDNEAKRAGYPLVRQPLIFDFGEPQAIIYNSDVNFHSTVAPWRPGDPLIVGGAFASYVEFVDGKINTMPDLGNQLLKVMDMPTSMRGEL